MSQLFCSTNPTLNPDGGGRRPSPPPFPAPPKAPLTPDDGPLQLAVGVDGGRGGGGGGQQGQGEGWGCERHGEEKHTRVAIGGAAARTTVCFTVRGVYLRLN